MALDIALIKGHIEDVQGQLWTMSINAVLDILRTRGRNPAAPPKAHPPRGEVGRVVDGFHEPRGLVAGE